MCFVVGGTTGQNVSGNINPPSTSCPSGSTLEYSLDNFATAGTTTIPQYDNQNEITVSTRCVCDSDDTMTSIVSSVTTDPGECPEPPECRYEFDIETMVTCNDFTFKINNIVAIGAASGRDILVSINGMTVNNLPAGTAMFTSGSFPADGSTIYTIELEASGVNPAFNCRPEMSATAPSGALPAMPRFIPNGPTTHN